MTANDWAAAADKYVSAMESECKADTKKFYNQDDGSGRAQSAIATLDALKTRLQHFVRA